MRLKSVNGKFMHPRTHFKSLQYRRIEQYHDLYFLVQSSRTCWSSQNECSFIYPRQRAHVTGLPHNYTHTRLTHTVYTRYRMRGHDHTTVQGQTSTMHNACAASARDRPATPITRSIRYIRAMPNPSIITDNWIEILKWSSQKVVSNMNEERSVWSVPVGAIFPLVLGYYRQGKALPHCCQNDFS